MTRLLAALACLCLAALAAGCSVPNPLRGPDIFVPKSDYGIPPTPKSYTEPGDCQGGSKLAALKVKDPEYPAAAFKRGQQGWVVVRLNVKPDGRTAKVKVIDALPKGPFDRAAAATVRRWRFQPPGEPGLQRCVVVLDYRLGHARIGL